MHRIILAALVAPWANVAPASAQTRRVMASAYLETNFHTRTIRAFLAEVEQASGGTPAVQPHGNASLLPLSQIKRGVRTGRIPLGEFLPFLATTWAQAAALGEAILDRYRALPRQ